MDVRFNFSILKQLSVYPYTYSHYLGFQTGFWFPCLRNLTILFKQFGGLPAMPSVANALFPLRREMLHKNGKIRLSISHPKVDYMGQNRTDYHTLAGGMFYQ